jgi:hypothetical protein
MNNTIAPFDTLACAQAIVMPSIMTNSPAIFGPSALGRRPARSAGLRNRAYQCAALVRFTNFKQAADILRLCGFDFGQTLFLSYDKNPSSLIPNPIELARELGGGDEGHRNKMSR